MVYFNWVLTCLYIHVTNKVVPFLDVSHKSLFVDILGLNSVVNKIYS